MTWFGRFAVVLILFETACVRGVCAGNELQAQLQNFASLAGPQQVAVVFNERFHGRSLLFWRRSAEVWRTAADSRLYGEQEILIHSPDASINSALASEVKSSEVERARYAVFLLCLRARFVPHSDFLIKQVNGFSWSPVARPGRISPFIPDLHKLGPLASQALTDAINSPNPKLRTTAKLYSFALLEDLSKLSTLEVATRWRKEVDRVRPCFSYSPDDFDEPAQLIFLLRTSLSARGLDGAIAISSLLKTETNPEDREREIEMLRFLDAASVRLRGSIEGQQVIQTVEKAALSQDIRFCGRRPYKTEALRQEYWGTLKAQFQKDEYSCSLDSWATLVALALDQQYGTHFTVATSSGKVCGRQLLVFFTYLTDLDPAFPAWESPSTGTQDDMLSPRFLAKIRRYHEAFIKMNTPS